MYSLKVSPTIDKKFVLFEPYTFSDVTVPKGYKTNGADVPWLFTLLIPRYCPMNLPMVVVHDYLTDLEQYEKADYLFETMFRMSGYTLRRRIAVWAVNLYHGVKYGR